MYEDWDCLCSSVDVHISNITGCVVVVLRYMNMLVCFSMLCGESWHAITVRATGGDHDMAETSCPRQIAIPESREGYSTTAPCSSQGWAPAAGVLLCVCVVGSNFSWGFSPFYTFFSYIVCYAHNITCELYVVF